MGAVEHAGAVIEQNSPSSSYPLNVIRLGQKSRRHMGRGRVWDVSFQTVNIKKWVEYPVLSNTTIGQFCP